MDPWHSTSPEQLTQRVSASWKTTVSGPSCPLCASQDFYAPHCRHFPFNPVKSPSIIEYRSLSVLPAAFQSPMLVFTIVCVPDFGIYLPSVSPCDVCDHPTHLNGHSPCPS